MRSLLIQAAVVAGPPLIVYGVTGALWPAALLAFVLALALSAIMVLREIRTARPGVRRGMLYAGVLAALGTAILPWAVGSMDHTGAIRNANALNRRVAFHQLVLQQLDRQYQLSQLFAYCARRERTYHEPFATAARRFLADRKAIGRTAVGRVLEEEVLPSPDTELLIRFRGKEWGDVTGTPRRLVPFSPQPAALVHVDAMGVRYVIEQ